MTSRALDRSGGAELDLPAAGPEETLAGFPPQSSKVCSRCGHAKPVDAFPVDRSKAAGRKSACRDCDNAKARAYYVANRGQVRARNLARYHAQRLS